MDLKKFLTSFPRLTFARLRLGHIRLWDNLRWGCYREFATDDIVNLIADFKKLPEEPPTAENDTTDNVADDTFESGSNYAILTRLCYQYYVYEGSDKLQQKIIGEVEAIVAELRNDDKAHADFEALLNRRHNNIMCRFRTEHPSLKEKDFRLYAYLVAGLSATTIAVLLDKDKSVVYNRISRLKRAIGEEFRLP